jgi:phage shock protein C
MSKRFYRSKDRVLGGVLSGFAEQINSDKKLVRIIYVLISILSAGFPGTLVYLILWAITPEKSLDI